MQAYLDPSKADDKWALSNLYLWEDEIWTLECSRGCGDFEISGAEATANAPDCLCPSCEYNSGIAEKTGERGWFIQLCLPGCMPDSEPAGPFETADKAIDFMREMHSDY